VYDFTMHRRDEAHADGVEPRWRMNNTATALVRQLLDQDGVLDWDEEGPPERPGPASGDWEDEDRAFDEAFRRWHAEQRGRVESADPETLLVPAVKFETNDDWEVFPAEARRIAATLLAVTDEDAKAAVCAEQELDAAEGGATAWGDTPVEDTVGTARAFGAYCEQAARFGGFRVS
jgi:hypothetical protein